MKARIDNDWIVEQKKDEIFAINARKGITHKIGTSGKKLNQSQLLKTVESYLKLHNFLVKEDK